MMRISCMAALLFMLSACGGAPEIAQSPDVQRAPGNVLPAPQTVDESGHFAYLLGPFDIVSVEVFGQRDLRRDVSLDGQGMMSFPLAGAIMAAGLTPQELQVVLTERLRQNHMRNPQVSVNIKDMQSHVISVGGQVRRPGLYPVMHEMTLMRAVARAGGVDENANTGNVIVFREVDGQKYIGLYNLSAINMGNYADPRIYPDDKIVVSASQSRRFMRSLVGLTGLITTPLILLVRG